MIYCRFYFTIDSLSFKQIDWLVFNTNFTSISAISWREQILYYINLDTYKIIRNKTYIYKLIKKKSKLCRMRLSNQRLHVWYSFHYTTKIVPYATFQYNVSESKI
jgi:hypothetical protein